MRESELLYASRTMAAKRGKGVRIATKQPRWAGRVESPLTRFAVPVVKPISVPCPGVDERGCLVAMPSDGRRLCYGCTKTLELRA